MSLVERAPQTRCYHCGSPEIAAVCHHCATAICDEHNQPKRRRGRSTAEFTDLDLDKTPAATSRCTARPTSTSFATRLPGGPSSAGCSPARAST